MPVQPRRTIHRGSVLASGLAFDTLVITEEVARRRILKLSMAVEVDAYRIGSVLVTRFREPIRLRCSEAGGSPLVRYGKVLSSAPLAPGEQTAIAAREESLVLVCGGNAFSFPLGDDAREDPADWIDLSGFLVVSKTRSLGRTKSAPRPAFQDATIDVRQGLGIVPLPPEAQELWRSLPARAAGRGESAVGKVRSFLRAIWVALRSTSAATRGRSILPAQAQDLRRSSPALATGRREGAVHAVGRLVNAVWLALRSILSPIDRRGTDPSDHGPSPDSDPAERSTSAPTISPWLSSIERALRRLFARALLLSKLASWVGHRHAAYLMRVIEMFDSDDLDNALRYAIPIGGKWEPSAAGLPLRTPSPRSALQIVPWRSAPTGGAIGLEEDLLESIRQRYRRAFERLAAQGKIERAAFVLAELLDANEEAVSFLERHGRLRLAAELAEARGLAAGLVVRQWFLAGDRGRAVRIARRTGAFSDAVVRLEPTHMEDAAALRLIWADVLASSGAYAAAVDVVWPIASARTLAVDWMDRAIEIGGLVGARMLVRKVRLLPPSFVDVRDRVVALLHQQEEGDWAIAWELAQELTDGESTPETRVLARAVVRSLGARRPDQNKKQFDRLLVFAADPALSADIRALEAPKKAPPPAPANAVRITAAFVTDLGKCQEHNEDACLVSSLRVGQNGQSTTPFACDIATDGIYLGVFDGCGGASSAAAGSALAARTVFTVLKDHFQDLSRDPRIGAGLLAAAVQQANKSVHDDATLDRARRGMGTTATVAAVSGATALFANVGDSRAYVLRSATLIQVTRDDTLYQQVLDAGHLEEAKEILENHPNIMTQALGNADRVQVGLTQVALHDGDRILLCTDGLSNEVSDDILRATLVDNPEPEAACQALLSVVLRGTAYDNISIVVARVQGESLPPAEAGPIEVVRVDTSEMDVSEASAVRKDAQLRLRYSAQDVGAVPIYDAVELPDGRLLAALGESGAWLVSSDGRVVARFSEPADQIVMSDHGDRAILLSARGEAFRLSRVDIRCKRVQAWCDARLGCFASEFDGAVWLVSFGGGLYAMDAGSADWESLWRVEEPNRRVWAIGRDAKSASVWFGSRTGDDSEVWSFDLPSPLPSMKLQGRRLLSMKDRVLGKRVAVSPSGKFVCCNSAEEKLCRGQLYDAEQWTAFHPDADIAAEPLAISDDWTILSSLDPDGSRIELFQTRTMAQHAAITLCGAWHGEARARIQGDRLVVCDRKGRLIVVSLATGRVVRNIRLA